MEMDLKKLSSAVKQIAHDRGIEENRVVEAIESALSSAYKKEYREKGEIIKANFDVDSGEIEFWQVKEIVDPDEVLMPDEEPDEDSDERKKRFSDQRHILLEDAKAEKEDAEVGDELRFPLEAHEEFGRIASQTAKQVIIQNVREAERSSITEEYKEKEGGIVSGVVQRVERGHVYVDLGRAMGIMFKNETIPGEHYQSGQRLRFYLLNVQEGTSRKPGIILSRAHPKFVVKLFELEVPEIAEGDVEIKKIAREPGSRTKIAVISNEEGIDPVGSAVGQRGARIMAVINELGNEKIDIVEWSEKDEEYVANAMSPAKVKLVEIEDNREAKVLVEEDQLSLAIGKGGQNVRLAAKLTGWKIDVRSQASPDEVQDGGVAELEEDEEGDSNDDNEKSKEDGSEDSEENDTEEQKDDEDEDDSSKNEKDEDNSDKNESEEDEEKDE